MNTFINRESVGRQWSSAYEIDVAAVNTQFKLAVVGECKWSENKIGISILRELEEKVLSCKRASNFLLNSRKIGITQ